MCRGPAGGYDSAGRSLHFPGPPGYMPGMALLLLLLLAIILIGAGATVHALIWLLIIGIILAIAAGGIGYGRRSTYSWRRWW